MTRKVMKFFVLLFASLGLLVSSVFGFTVSLTNNNTAYIITGSDYNISGNLIVPEIYNGKPVVGISNDAFNDRNFLTSVTLPSSIQFIGSRAFNSCANLQTVHLPNGLLEISDFAFANCREFSDVVIPESVLSINEGAFSSSGLNTVTFGSNLVTIGKQAFFDNRITNLVLPESIQNIDREAFAYNSSLMDITFHGDAPSVGYQAFHSVNATVNVNAESSGFGENGYYWEGMLINVVPEPSTYALLLGVAVLGYAFWRRRK